MWQPCNGTYYFFFTIIIIVTMIAIVPVCDISVQLCTSVHCVQGT